MLITLTDVGFSYGDNLIFSGVNFAINEGERIALVGENGVGKTTLVKLLLGQLNYDAGEIIKKNGLKIGYLAQNGGYDGGSCVYEEMRGVFREEIEAVNRLNSLSAALSEAECGSAEYNVLTAKIEALNRFIASEDCYNVDVKIKTVLNGMGFEGFYDREIAAMSGGEKTRLKLARLLLEEPDLLILDEPTNHLDVKTLYWLEDYLQGFKGAVFVVSHDRYFLDAVTRRTLEIENGRLFSYKGSYSAYKPLKEQRIERELKEYEKQREEIEKLQTYVDRNIVRATTAKSAQSRVKQLERMQVLQKPYTPPSPPKLEFTFERESAEEVLAVKDLNLQIGGKTLICGGGLQIVRGRKVALVGENGTGKSTFLKAVCAGGNGAITLGRFVKIAYYDQEMANLNPENTVLAELWERHAAYSQTEIRASLARCGLVAEDMDKKVKELSGGERAKLAMCVFENAHGNFLILDEPTNHLDLPARESLEAALKAFTGTVLFVSHDRYFIGAVADSVAEIEDGKLNFYEGGYEGYKRAKAQKAEREREEAEAVARERYEERKVSTWRTKKDRAAEAKLKAEIKAIEADICRNEQREEELNALLSDPAVAADYTRLAPVLKELEEIKRELDALYERYGEMLG